MNEGRAIKLIHYSCGRGAQNGPVTQPVTGLSLILIALSSQYIPCLVTCVQECLLNREYTQTGVLTVNYVGVEFKTVTQH